jgi:hypothetical protein
MGVLCSSIRTDAVLFYSSGDTAYNTTEPTGSLTNSGWQFQGTFLQYLGTPVSAHHFITAKHLNVPVGNTFTFDGTTYTTIAKIPDPGSDLVLYEVDGTFPRYAPLYESTDEVGKDFVVFGRGTQRGAVVTANGDTKGWKWGPYDGVMRWGENRVDATTTVIGSPVLQADFDSSGGTGANECMLSDKDSGGAIFIQDGGIWKLAGINWAIIPGKVSFSSSGSSPFNAALFDYSFKVSDSEKIYYNDGQPLPWPYLSGNGNDPVRFYPTRISSRYTWITNNIPDFDQDVDGLPDWWETLYVGDPTSMEPDDDLLDNDGFTNYEEWIADTVPNDSNSYLRVSAYTNATEVAFDSSTNRKYQIEFRADLADTNETWQTEPGLEWFPATNSPTIKTVSTTTSNRVYRVDAKLR